MARQVSRKKWKSFENKSCPSTTIMQLPEEQEASLPIPGKCTTKDVCYSCKIERGDNHRCESYIGQTSRQIKKRIGEHLGDARKYRPEKPVGSRLSHYIGDLFFNDINHTLTWSIEAQKSHYSPIQDFCMLCNWEKVLIIYNPQLSTLNLRNELFGWCPHKEKYLLLNS